MIKSQATPHEYLLAQLTKKVQNAAYSSVINDSSVGCAMFLFTACTTAVDKKDTMKVPKVERLTRGCLENKRKDSND